MISCKEFLILFLLVIVLSKNINWGTIIPLISSQDPDNLNDDTVFLNPRGIHRFNGLYRLTKTIKRSQNKIPNVAYSEVTEEPHNNPVMLIHRDKTNRGLYRILSRMHTRVQKRSQNAMLDDVSTVFRIYKYFNNQKVKLYDFWKQFDICAFLF